MSLKSVIEQIQNLLSTSYVQIGEDFQFLRETVDNSIRESESMVNDFRSSIESGKPDSLKSIISQAEYTVSDAEKKYSNFSKELIAIFNTIKKSFEIISEMNKPIEQIIDSAELMELLALNSMVVAIQAGKDGGGFTFITEELQKNAKVIFSHANEINNQRKSVLMNYDQLKIKTNEILLNQQNIEEFLNKTLQEDFSIIHNNLKDSISFFEKINNKASDLRPLVLKIMEGIQNQDIIRQSLDHVYLSVEEIEKSGRECQEDESTVINQKLLELCMFVTDEVAIKLENDLSAITKSINEIERHLNYLEDNKNDYYNNHIKKNSSTNNLVSGIDAISSSFLKLIQIIDKNIEFEKIIIRIKNSLYSSFINLNNANRQFETPLTLFKNIIIMARIEIARQPVIRNVEISIARIYSEISKIFSSVTTIEDINNEVIKVNSVVEKEFEELIAGSNDFIVFFRSDIEKIMGLCKNSTEIIIKIIGSLKFLNDDYIDTFESLRSQILKIQKSNDLLAVLKNDIKILYSDVSKQYATISQERIIEISNNDRIKQLLNKFTIFRHKGKLLEIEGDNTSVADSSVTLF